MIRCWQYYYHPQKHKEDFHAIIQIVPKSWESKIPLKYRSMMPRGTWRVAQVIAASTPHYTGEKFFWLSEEALISYWHPIKKDEVELTFLQGA